MSVEILPPMMGFPQECIFNGTSCVSFYTCVIGPFRIFVYFPGALVTEGWMLERIVDVPQITPENQFFGAAVNYAMQRDWRVPCDPLTLKALIHHVTSESNSNEPDPTGATHGVCPLPQEK